jgi:hypothetical protein
VAQRWTIFSVQRLGISKTICPDYPAKISALGDTASRVRSSNTRPKYVPIWFSCASERLQWRSLIVQDVAVADRFLLQKGVPEHLQDWEILAYEFRLIGEPVVEFLREREVNSDGQRESAASN